MPLLERNLWTVVPWVINNRIACHVPSKYVNTTAQDRDKWPALMNTLMNSGFHKMWYVSWPAEELVGSHKMWYVSWPAEELVGSHKMWYVSWPAEELVGSYKMWYVSSPAEELVSSRLGLYSVQLASYAIHICVHCLRPYQNLRVRRHHFFSVHHQTESWRQFLHGTHMVVWHSANCCVNHFAYFSVTYHQYFRSVIAVLPTWKALRSIIWLLLLIVGNCKVLYEGGLQWHNILYNILGKSIRSFEHWMGGSKNRERHIECWFRKPKYSLRKENMLKIRRQVLQDI